MKPPIVIIGAGLAGTACLSELVQAGCGPLLIVDRHEQAGSQASTQNGGLIRSHASNPHTAALARLGARWWAEQKLAPFDRCGSILVGGQSAELLAGFRRDDHRWLRDGELSSLLGHRPTAEVRAFFNRLDGIADAPALVAAWLEQGRKAGAQIRLNCEAELEEQTLMLDGQEQPYSALVIAGGAWSAELLDLPLQAFSRHLFRCRSAALPTRAPWLWDLDEEVYFRADEQDVVLSACDEAVVPSPDRVAWPRPSASAYADLQEKVARRWPSLGTLDLIESWVGLRTLSPDDGLVLGADRRNERLFWCAGLGGHGVTCAQPAARLAMSALTIATLSGEEQALARAHSSDRFATLRETWND